MKKTIFALCCTALAGCGSGEPSTATVDSFITNIATQQCAWEFRCCTDAELKTDVGTKFMSQDACVPYFELPWQDELYAERLAVRQGRLKLDDKQAAACITQMMAQPCSPPTGPKSLPTAKAGDCSLAKLFIGTTPKGKPCQYAGECEKGSRCVGDNEFTPGSGVCVPLQQENDICNADTDCDPTVPLLYCARKDWKCHKLGGNGDPCAYTMDSIGKPKTPMMLACNTTANLYCDQVSSTCKPLPVAGQPCTVAPSPDVGVSCDPTPSLHLSCKPSMADPTVGVCVGLPKLGEDCTGSCDTGLYCDFSPPRKCKTLPTLGESCFAVFLIPCADPYYCNPNAKPTAYSCDKYANAGDACPFGVTCDPKTLYCDNSAVPAMPVCKAKVADGQPCKDSTQCLSGGQCGGTPMVCNPPPPGVAICKGR
jgi:hypothetical protein